MMISLGRADSVDAVSLGVLRLFQMSSMRSSPILVYTGSQSVA